MKLIKKILSTIITTITMLCATANAATPPPNLRSVQYDPLTFNIYPPGLHGVGGGGDTVNVLDYGAVGDNSTPNDTAFANAIAACQSYSSTLGGTIKVPSGRYLFLHPVTLPDGCILDGDGPGGSIMAFNYSADLTQTNGIQFASKPLIFGHQWGVKNVMLHAESKIQGAAIYIGGTTFPSVVSPYGLVDNVYIGGNNGGLGNAGTWQYGVFNDDVQQFTYNHVTSDYCQSNAFDLTFATAPTLINCYAAGNYGYGFHISAIYGGAYSCLADSCQQGGYLHETDGGGGGFVYAGCGSEGCGGNGYTLHNAYGTTLLGCYTRQSVSLNGTETTNAFAIDGGSGNTLIGCQNLSDFSGTHLDGYALFTTNFPAGLRAMNCNFVSCGLGITNNPADLLYYDDVLGNISLNGGMITISANGSVSVNTANGGTFSGQFAGNGQFLTNVTLSTPPITVPGWVSTNGDIEVMGNDTEGGSATAIYGYQQYLTNTFYLTNVHVPFAAWAFSPTQAVIKVFQTPTNGVVNFYTTPAATTNTVTLPKNGGGSMPGPFDFQTTPTLLTSPTNITILAMGVGTNASAIASVAWINDAGNLGLPRPSIPYITTTEHNGVVRYQATSATYGSAAFRLDGYILGGSVLQNLLSSGITNNYSLPVTFTGPVSSTNSFYIFSPNGTRYIITVNNSGTLGTTAQ